jgi:4-hydroxybenzoate polyprenyltransferase
MGVGENRSGQPRAPRPPHTRTSASGWLELLRPPNLLTAPGDPIAGALLVSPVAAVTGERMVLVALVGLLLYASGTAMNDAADARVDERERPGRPIPRGAVPRSAAAALSVALAGLALVFAFAAGLAVFKVAVALAAAIFLYNVAFKRVPVLGPITMGACRGLNLAMGAALVPEALFGKVVVVAAAVLAAYIAAVTQLARRETEATDPGPYLLWTPAAILVIGMLAFAAVAPFPQPRDMHILTAFIVLACARAFVSTVKPRRGRGFRRAGVATMPMVIGSLVSNVLFIQAAFAAGAGAGLDGLIIACVLVLAWPVNRLLAGKFHAS